MGARRAAADAVLLAALAAGVLVGAACGGPQEVPDGDPGLSADPAALRPAPLRPRAPSSSWPDLRRRPEPIRWGLLADEARAVVVDPVPYEEAGISLGYNNLPRLLGKIDEARGAGWHPCADAAARRVPFFDADSAHPLFAAALDGGDGCVAGEATAEPARVWSARASSESTVYQAVWNLATEDVRVRLAGLWPTDVGFFVLRTELSGNRGTDTYTVRLAKFNTRPGGYYLQAVGHGVAGRNDSYFLVKISDADRDEGGGGTTLGPARYFCWSGAEATLQDVTDDVDDSPCGAYRTAVDALRGFTVADLPLAPFDAEPTR